ncbi:MAG: citramalate synthase [Candidatus Nanopelagicales bacterium]|nr:citramalate synthase [Candidatus Nanopelagicales bacterium]MCF8536507.1 citramalate synthase [Candidatus Nanopelagicales bacterium]MCF8542838.1 citramalate synthase [Candidatus Nanopelagicales bacterium]MCF8557242.1 citramalate synthase [Candidatus Nanopelagicales bacterium]
MARPDGFHVYDTTLRDGAQREGISYSVNDKLAVARLLDDYGVGFIEGGWPGALPKDTEFFQRAQSELSLKNAELVAFGATRKAGVAVEEDQQVRALLDSQAPVITLVAKSDVRHVAEALRTTLDENEAMVRDTVRFLVSEGRRVFVDMEHFFDGYKHDRDYGVRLLIAAADAGASVGVLCDTNGGMLPHGMFEVVTDVKERSGVRLGIHCQDDTGCAIANSVSAVEAGVSHVQCTANGYGERTGNADLFVVVPNLQLKLGIDCLPDGALQETVRISHAIAEIANIAPNTHQPYAGWASFAHKAGLHASALKVNADLYNHIDPSVVGNQQNVLVTEMAGRASIELKGAELGHDLSGKPEVVSRVVEQVKVLESQGWSFEAADASFELLILGSEGKELSFEVESWRTIVEQDADGVVRTEATVKIHLDGERIISTAEGNGPVNALDRALRRAIVQKYPELEGMRLVDYKVRILDEKAGTGAKTRVLIGTTDGQDSWSTVGVHENVIAASWRSLEDAVRYGLLRLSR